MTIAAVSRCGQCDAVVNIHWPSCLVCRTILPSAPGISSSGLKLDHRERAKGPIAPILPGWLVTYRNRDGKLCGGYEDKAHGTVQECCWHSGHWTVYLTDGQQVPLSFIRAVGQTNDEGRICAAWTVREHGYAGKGF